MITDDQINITTQLCIYSGLLSAKSMLPVCCKRYRKNKRIVLVQEVGALGEIAKWCVYFKRALCLNVTHCGDISMRARAPHVQ